MSKLPEILILAVSNIDLDSVKTEISNIRKNLKKAVTLQYISDPIEKLNIDFNTLENLLNENTKSNQITMLHYTGHSSEKGILVKVEGVERIMVINSIESLVETHKKFRFVFLNSCYSESIAKQLIDIGVPYVIGTIGKVGDEDASKVAAKFYEYLGVNSYTIQEAYKKTKTYFLENPDELKIDGDFRSLRTSDDDVENNVWKLYFDDNKLTPEQKNWTLMPKANLILSDPENKDKLKFLCLYEEGKTEIYKELYSSLLFPKENEIQVKEEVKIDRVQNGLWNINSGNFDRDSFLKELNNADFVIHFLSTNYQDMIENIIKIDFENKEFKTIKHIHIPINGSLDIFKAKNWFKKENVLKPKILLNDANTIDKIRNNTRLSPSNLEFFNEFFSESFENTISSIVNPQLLKETLKNIPFIQASDGLRNTHSNTLFFTLIEGTKSCGAILLVNFIKNRKKVNKNIPILKIPWKSESGEKLIKSDKDFWKELKNVLNLKNVRIPLGSDDASLCIETIYQKMVLEDTILVFNNIDDLNIYKNEIIQNFWNRLKNGFSDFEKFILNATEDDIGVSAKKINGKVFVFVINNDIMNLSFDKAFPFIKDTVLKTNPEMEITISPIDKFTPNDFDDWNEIQSFENIDFKALSSDSTPIYRQELIAKICTLTNCYHLSRKITFDNLI